MKLMDAIVDGKLIWGISPSDPKTIPLECIPGWSLVNPLVLRELQDSSRIETKATYIVGDKVLVNTNGIALILTDPEVKFSWEAEESFEWSEKVLSLLANLRYASKQYSIPRQLVSWGPGDILELPDPQFPSRGEGAATSGWIIEAAITTTDITLAGRRPTDTSPPLYDTILLDAMEASVRKDYRTTILYSAVSVETLAKMKLTQAFELACSQNNSQDNTLKIAFHQTDESTSKKREDLLFKMTIQGKRNFQYLFHELPLLFMGKSLREEDKSLYDEAHNLYNTRTQIVHSGIAPEKQNFFQLNIWGAHDALRCAIKVVDWFGEMGGYAIPNEKGSTAFVSLANPTK